MALRKFIFLSSAILALTVSHRGMASLSLDFGSDISLIYLDHLKRPDTSMDNIPFADKVQKKEEGFNKAENGYYAQSQVSTQSNPRTLGLKEAALWISISRHKHSEVRLRLRPDAGLQRGVETNTEYDSRSGEAYRTMPSIQLLDTYEILLKLSREANIAFGVFESVYGKKLAYRSLLDFGLFAMLPRKISGAKVHFNSQTRPVANTAKDIAVGGIFDLWLHNGRRDRSELLGSKEQTFDYSPAKSDAYMGLAISSNYTINQEKHVTAIAGYGDTKVENGRVNESYLAISFFQSTNVLNYKWKLVIDTRITKERWLLSEGQLPELTQQSLALTNKLQATTKIALIQGFHYGLSHRHLENTTSKETLTGWQIDLGAEIHNIKDVSLGIMSSAENRKSDLGFGTAGFRSTTNSSSYLLRFAFEIRHTLR